jgi:IS1 family transposase/transposase-like protein
MTIQLELYCPHCQSANVTKNGKKSYDDKQNYLCKDCNRQFIGDHALTYKGCHSLIIKAVLQMFVLGASVRDISTFATISIRKVLSILINSNRVIIPKQSHYDFLEVDEFWTYVGNKKNKVWLIYAYHRATGEIVSYVWGKRDYKTAKRLRDKLKSQGVTFDTVYTDNWDSFRSVFQNDNHIIGKDNTKGIEGNNCRLRHRIKRAVRKTCCFSKKLLNHFKAFDLAFFYINYGVI